LIREQITNTRRRASGFASHWQQLEIDEGSNGGESCGHGPIKRSDDARWGKRPSSRQGTWSVAVALASAVRVRIVAPDQPQRGASPTAANCDETSSFRRMAWIWVRTVTIDTTKSSAISLADLPSISAART